MLLPSISPGNFLVSHPNLDRRGAFCADTTPCEKPQPSLVCYFWTYRDTRKLLGEEVTEHCEEQLTQILIEILLEIRLV